MLKVPLSVSKRGNGTGIQGSLASKPLFLVLHLLLSTEGDKSSCHTEVTANMLTEIQPQNAEAGRHLVKEREPHIQCRTPVHSFTICPLQQSFSKCVTVPCTCFRTTEAPGKIQIPGPHLSHSESAYLDVGPGELHFFKFYF